MADNPQPLSRIGVLGDIHCEAQRLATALDFLAAEQLELVCAVGDLVDGREDVNRTLALLAEHQVAAVRGNHERWLLNNEMRGLPDANSRFELDANSWCYLPQLPITREFETVAGRLLLCHGLGQNDMAGVYPWDDEFSLHSNKALWQLVNRSDYRFVVCGHTHRRLVSQFDQLTIINAGTLYYQHEPCFMIVNFAEMFVQYYNLPAPDEIKKAELIPLAQT